MSGERVGCSCGGAITVLDRTHASIAFDLDVYSLEAIFRAAYKLTDRCYLLLKRVDNTITVFLLGKEAKDDVAPLVGMLANELVDQQLREQLERRFGSLRTIIAAQAFAEGNLLEPERDHADYNEDPLGIGKPR